LLEAAGAVALGAAGFDTAAAAAAASARVVDPYGVHQAGITTRQQAFLLFAVYDVDAVPAAALRKLLADWTAAAARLCTGQPVGAAARPAAEAPADNGEALGLGPARLTVTFGFGARLFDDRFGLSSRRPAPLVALPAFAGDQLDARSTGGDLCVQACADDPLVVEHAVRCLTRIGEGIVTPRWQQAGFLSRPAGGGTPRNMLGFKDGTANLDPNDAARMDANVWASSDSSPSWMLGGTYLVARRVRNFVEHWDRSSLNEQQRSIGREKLTGAPLGETSELAQVDPARLPADSHIRLANPRTGADSERERILRRGYNYANGLAPLTSSRRDEEGNRIQGTQDSGLMFLAYQQDPRRQFVPIQTRLAASDALGEYLAHVASGVFAIPPGIHPVRSIGDALFA
jgi:deferrochelatase/peroxidase EfeB